MFAPTGETHIRNVTSGERALRGLLPSVIQLSTTVYFDTTSRRVAQHSIEPELEPPKREEST